MKYAWIKGSWVWVWMDSEWWRYLFAKRRNTGYSWPAVVWCRLRGHPAGVWWYNVGGTEPDMHCQGCGDDLG